MIVWLIVIVTIVAAMTILVLMRRSKVETIERFQSQNASSGLTSWSKYNATQGTGASGNTGVQTDFSSFLKSIGGVSGAENNIAATLDSASTNYVDSQSNYGQNVLGKEVMTNKNMPNYSGVMDTSVNQADVYLGSPEHIVVKNLEPDNQSQFTSADLHWCKQAAMPIDMPPHIKGASVGCGWYYIPDLNTPSSGALGQSNGPIFPDTVPNMGNGQWIWDLAYAEQLEEIKNCKRVKACESINVPSVNGICGFCYDKGYAMPAHTDGSEKYPNNKDATCNTPLIMNSDQCHKPPPAPLVTPAGFNCGNFGFPSADYSLRLYNNVDCTQNLNGKWNAADQTCDAADGSSISQKCSGLNGAAPAASVTVCTPDNNGALSAACLVSLAKAIGYTSQGSIIQMLQTGNAPSQIDTVAMDILKGQNVPVNPVLYKGGVILPADASTAFDNIYSLIKTGASPIVQQAAAWLCIGSADFDPCNLPDTTPGPFFTQCIQQQWRISGCQPAGTEYPSQQTTIDQLNMLKWGDVKTQFDSMYKSMSVADPNQQDINVKRCLGITTKRAVPKPCVGVSQLGLVIGLDQMYFQDNANIAKFAASGNWPSNGSYTGNFVVSGTKSCDGTGVYFDGTSVAGGPNVKSLMTIAPPVPPAPVPQVMNGPWIGRDLPIQNVSTDDQGNKVYMVYDDSGPGNQYTKMVNANNDARYYAGTISQYSSAAWPSYNSSGNNYVLSPNPKSTVKMYDPSKPILTAGGTLRDIGYPPGGMGISGDQKTYFSIAFNYGVNPIQSSDGTVPTLINEVNAALKATDGQALTVTVTTASGLTFTGPVTSMGNGGWLYFISGKGPSPVVPDGSYYVKQNNGQNIAPYTAWGGLGGGTMSATLTLQVAGGGVSESREVWINPSVDTCEILAVFTGPSYSQTYTALGLYKGQLVVALQSTEKGYTFFNAGPITTNQWSHVVHVYNNGNHSIYINGIGPVSMGGLTAVSTGNYCAYSLGGGSQMNPFYQNKPAPVPFQGQIGAFRVYNRALTATDIQNNLASSLPYFVDNVQLATKNDPNAIAMAAGQFYVPSLANAINYRE